MNIIRSYHKIRENNPFWQIVIDQKLQFRVIFFIAHIFVSWMNYEILIKIIKYLCKISKYIGKCNMTNKFYFHLITTFNDSKTFAENTGCICFDHSSINFCTRSIELSSVRNDDDFEEIFDCNITFFRPL